MLHRLISPARPQPRCSPCGRAGRPLLPIVLSLLLSGCLGGKATADADDPAATQRAAFQTAAQTLQNGTPVALDSFTTYPLYPYLLYRDLTRRLTQNPAGEVHRFLQDYRDSPLAGRLRAAWLQQLAEQQRWPEFLQDYQPLDQVGLDCWRRQALLATGQRTAALAGIQPLWLRGSSLPNACDPVFQVWRQQGGLTNDLIWQRFQLALEQDDVKLARYLQGLLPAGERPAAERWLAVAANPRLLLEPDHYDPADPRTTALLLYGLRRWSRQDSVSAAAALAVLQPRYGLRGDAVIALERQLALFLAGRRQPAALQRLNALPAAAVDTPVREWRIRIGLLRGDWPLTLQWLDRLTADEQRDPRWQYWRARALEATGQAEAARALYRQVASQRDYHGFLAADRLRLPYSLNDVPLPVNEAALTALAQRLALRRAQELYRLGWLEEARAEWTFALAASSPAELQQAAQLAYRWGWYDQAIVTLARTAYWDDLALRFPLPQREPIEAGAGSNGLDPAWVYAVIRQESGFRPDARSPVGALGLMQLLPATGRQIAQTLQQDLADPVELLDPATNLRYGTRYLRLLRDQFQGSLLLATAAYNAGPDKVLTWLPEQGTLEADRWAETIPYLETRKYVQRVLEFAVVYGRRLGTEPTLGQWLGPVPARATLVGKVVASRLAGGGDGG